ncbi:MAG: hypothetical protein IPK26_20545 [Planctomycetes bacterium]|nr:hypothetical protein [Planctomycetota bacterium]
MPRHTPLFPLALLTFATNAAAQAAHTQLFPATSPSGRAGLHGVSDGSGMLVFGGLTSGSPLAFNNEMWRFDGTAWTNLTPANSPAPRDWYASAYDGARSRYVLFGGRVLSGTVGIDNGDTWEFDGTNWTQSAPAISPSARRWAAMVWDVNLAKCVLFGGSTSGTTFLGDTWTWDGTNWVQLTPAASPSPRARGWLEWDLLRGRAVYFGGKNTTANLALGETWSWDSTTWTQIPTSVAPGWNSGTGLIAYGMTYDLVRDRMVLVGGTRTTASVSPQTYEFDGTDWILQATGGLPGRTAPAIAYVAAAAKTFVFGGSAGVPLNDTFEYQTDDWPAFTPFGAGCTGSGGTPSLTELHAAWLGETQRTSVGNLSPASLAIMALGLSNTAWAGGSLPFPLLLLYPNTQPGCQLLTSPDATVSLTVTGTTAEFALPLPANTALLGTAAFLQSVQLESSLALSVSAGAALTLGAK